MIDIYVDMDGVLADFYSYVNGKYGKDFKDIINREEFWDDESQHDRIFANLNPLHDAKTLVKTLLKFKEEFGVELHILTALPNIEGGGYPEAADDKKKWISEHFGFSPELYENFKTGPLAVDKQNHCSKHDILIDDNPRNIVQWQHQGGIGILHVSGRLSNTIESVKEHLRQLGCDVDHKDKCKNNL